MTRKFGDGTPRSSGTFEIRPVGPYSLAASARFLEGFAPAAYDGSGKERLRFVFVGDGFAEGNEAVAGVSVRAEGDVVVGEVYGGADAGAVRRQVARILSLDVDGSGFLGVGVRDPIVQKLQARYPGLRPVLFYSPYEAAAWAIIGQRVRIVQATKVKARMAEEMGAEVEIRGEPARAFPGPSRLLELEEFPGLTPVKVERLGSLAAATREGKLDAGYLRSLPVEEALEELQRLPGIGPFSAELILLRGAGEPDQLPIHEPRLARAVAMAYGLDKPPDAAGLERMAESWRPYRTWVSLYLRAMLEEETREISGTAGGYPVAGKEAKEKRA